MDTRHFDLVAAKAAIGGVIVIGPRQQQGKEGSEETWFVGTEKK